MRYDPATRNPGINMGIERRLLNRLFHVGFSEHNLNCTSLGNSKVDSDNKKSVKILIY